MRLPRYEDWAPTDFDAPGRGLGSSIDDGRADWLVAPCMLTRDSRALERTNWETITRSLCETDTGEDIELLEFGHWVCGWFSVWICRPDSPAAKVAQEWAERLEDYPVADEEALSRAEAEEAADSWDDWGRYEWRVALGRELSAFDWDDVSDEALDNLWDRYGTEWTGSDGPHFDVDEAAAKVTRADALACGAVEVLP